MIININRKNKRNNKFMWKKKNKQIKDHKLKRNASIIKPNKVYRNMNHNNKKFNNRMILLEWMI